MRFAPGSQDAAESIICLMASAPCALKNSRENQCTETPLLVIVPTPSQNSLRMYAELIQRRSSVGRAKGIATQSVDPAIYTTVLSSRAPAPNAEAATSPQPQTTGVPASRPVSAAAALLTPPITSAGPAIPG